jgi:hypothetical protein
MSRTQQQVLVALPVTNKRHPALFHKHCQQNKILRYITMTLLLDTQLTHAIAH